MKRYCQHLLQKLSNNGGVDAAEEQMKARQYKIIEPTLKSKACLKCLYFTKIISDLCRYLEYFSYLCIINQTERQCLKRQIRILS